MFVVKRFISRLERNEFKIKLICTFTHSSCSDSVTTLLVLGTSAAGRGDCTAGDWSCIATVVELVGLPIRETWPTTAGELEGKYDSRVKLMVPENTDNMNDNCLACWVLHWLVGAVVHWFNAQLQCIDMQPIWAPRRSCICRGEFYLETFPLTGNKLSSPEWLW